MLNGLKIFTWLESFMNKVIVAFFMYLLSTGSVIMACNTELEIAVGHWPFYNQFLPFGRANPIC